LHNYFKNHWFGTIMTVIVILFIAEFFIILNSPHQDASGRGFSACTQTMIDNIHGCRQNTWCVFKTVSKNYICYNKIIYTGLKNWLIGSSKTPWSDYYYAEEKQKIAELEEFYNENPNVIEQMQSLKEQSLELEKINENK